MSMFEYAVEKVRAAFKDHGAEYGENAARQWQRNAGFDVAKLIKAAAAQ